MKRLQKFVFPTCLAVGIILGILLGNAALFVGGSALIGIALHFVAGLFVR